jgi:hypothetical protein
MNLKSPAGAIWNLCSIDEGENRKASNDAVWQRALSESRAVANNNNGIVLTWFKP